MHEHDLLAGHPASEELSRGLTLGDVQAYCVQSWADIGVAPPAAWQKRQSPAIPSRDETSAEKVLQSFNTWAFKREQPSDPQLMLALISRAIKRSEPLSFALYWGKGPRVSLAQADVQCLDFLARLSDRVGKVHAPGAALNLIFTDTHARLNGYAQGGIHGYFSEVDMAARQRGFGTRRLSDLVRASKLPAEGNKRDEMVPRPILSMLIASAMKWYRGNGSAEEGAVIYYRMNMVERRAVELAFPWSIFITFNGSELRGLFPEHLPIFYMYSLRRGTCVKPWFLPAQATAGTASSCACRASQND
jgi:L-tyrosine isonitrile synthase